MSLLRLLQPARSALFNALPPRSAVAAAAANKLSVSAADRGVDISVFSEGRRLRAAWTSSVRPSTYHSVWLRHNCQYSECLNTSNQNSVLSYELDPHVAIEKAMITAIQSELDSWSRDVPHCPLPTAHGPLHDLDGENVSIKWSCGHKGHLNLDWLRRNCYSSHTLEEARNNSAPTYLKWDMPTMKSEELEDDLGVMRWLKMVNEYGACLVTGVPCTREDGLKVCHKIAPYLQETFYGGLTEIKVHDYPISTPYGSAKLEPHMDLPMYESHPGISILHCLRNDECVEGGESTIVDALAVAEKLRVTHPHHFATLVRVPSTYHCIHYERDYPVHMVYRTPHIHLNGHDEIVKLRWSPHNDGPLRVAEEDVEPYYEAYAVLAKAIHSDCEHQFNLKLKPGDMLVLNDHRMLHGRTDFQLNGGVRHVNNCGLNIDEFKSRLQVLCAKYDPDYQPKNILNHDFSFSTAARITS